MHTPESKCDAQLLDLGVDANLLKEFADMPVVDLDIPFVPLDLPDPAEAGPPVARREESAGIASSIPTLGCSSNSVRITIRIPRAVLEGFKARAAGGSVGYQTLIIRALREWLNRASRSAV